MQEHEEVTTTNLRQLTSLDFTFSKRQVGLVLFGVGGMGLVGLLGLDSFGMGRDAEFGPAQTMGIIIAALVTLAGASLIPFGKRFF